jgi:thiol-disulfide isomerase/thioredoxin
MRSKSSRRRPIRAALALAVVLGAALVGPRGVGDARPAHAAEESPQVGRRAPKLLGEWLNTRPLKPADLNGRVTLVEFWAFECINCRRTLPAMRALFERYPAGGDVVIVGVHTPELPIERDADSVRTAVAKLDVRYPVVLDNSYSDWRAFENDYWPELYLIDRRGVIRHVHVGELHQGTEEWTQLLAKIEALRRERT